MGVAPTLRLIRISTEHRAKELVPSEGIQFPTGVESRLSALMEHAMRKVWNYPSGIRTPSCGGQLLTLMEHTIET